jgi:hypothetical protein
MKVFYVYLQYVVPVFNTCHTQDEAMLKFQCRMQKILESDKRHFGWRKQVDIFALKCVYNSKLREVKIGSPANSIAKRIRQDFQEMMKEFKKKTEQEGREREKKETEIVIASIMYDTITLIVEEERSRKRRHIREEKVIRKMLSGMTKKVVKEVERERKKQKKRKRLEKVKEKEERLNMFAEDTRTEKREREMLKKVKLFAVTLLYKELDEDKNFPARHGLSTRHIGRVYATSKKAADKLLEKYKKEPWFCNDRKMHDLLLEEFKRMKRHNKDYCDLIYNWGLVENHCFKSDKYWWPIIQSIERPYINWIY